MSSMSAAAPILTDAQKRGAQRALRVSIGSREENDRFLGAMNDAMKEEMTR